MDSTDLAARMKLYEAATSLHIDSSRWMIIRIDGRAFHTYTRGLERPFDWRLADDLDHAAQVLCADVDGAKAAYLQSDECSVVVPPAVSEHWFGGKVQKVASVAASVFTAAFLECRDGATFDARVISLPDEWEVRAYLCWRQADCRRNAVSMVAQSVFSHKQLNGRGTGERLEMLEREGVVFESFPTADRLGRWVTKENYVGDVTFFDPRKGVDVTVEGVVRSRWVSEAAPVFRDLPLLPEALTTSGVVH